MFSFGLRLNELNNIYLLLTDTSHSTLYHLTDSKLTSHSTLYCLTDSKLWAIFYHSNLLHIILIVIICLTCNLLKRLKVKCQNFFHAIGVCIIRIPTNNGYRLVRLILLMTLLCTCPCVQFLISKISTGFNIQLYVRQIITCRYKL